MSLYTTATTLRDWAATVGQWRHFKQETGTWPLISIAASSFHTLGFVAGVGFLIWYREKHRWNENHFILILAAVLLPYVFTWDWLRDKIYVGELRRVMRQRGDNSDFRRNRPVLHRENKTESFAHAKGRAGNGSRFVSATLWIDNAMFVVFLALIAASIIARAIFWILGW
ncbi:MAG: hypothetical protein LAO08_09730 [Acidobacteriia bacterium]|nr:hypothetical protein [Terriglobia bacterium]